MGLRSHPTSAEGSSQIGEQTICFQKLNPSFLHEKHVLNPLGELSVALGLYNSIFIFQVDVKSTGIIRNKGGNSKKVKISDVKISKDNS